MAAKLRQDTIKMIYNSKSGHPGGSLSAADIISALYFYKMNIKTEDSKWADRDRFVLSKGHAAPVVFAALVNKGFIPREELWSFRHGNGSLQGTVNIKNPGGDMTVGSLGQYLSVSAGMALAGKMDKKDYKVYVMLGDGELQEGQVWEAAMAAAHMRLGNLVGILDNNRVQMCGMTDDVMSIGDIAAKFRAFGWKVVQIDGHDMQQIVDALDAIPNQPDAQPTMIIADTIKGKGVSYMEGTPAWHGGVPTKEQYEQAMRELGGEYEIK
nr:transketolase [uncultured Sphaerochaeta sp.]